MANAPVYEPLLPKTQKGEPLIFHNGKWYHCYMKNQNLGVDYLRCDSCHVGTAKRDTATGEIVNGTVNCVEGCFVNMDVYAQREFRQIAKEKFASTAVSSTATAVDMAAAEFNVKYGPGFVYNANAHSLKSSLYKKRAARIPPLPHNFAEIPDMANFPMQYMHTLDDPNEQFLYVNEPFNNVQRIMAFSTLADITSLASSNSVYMDGTFRVTPEPFVQLFTLNSFVGPNEDRQVLMPRVYFLLPGKGQDVYARVLQLTLQLVEMAFDLTGNGDGYTHWRYINSDFEAGIIAAAKSVDFDPLQMIRLRGCHFHYCSALYRFATTGIDNMHGDYFAADKLLVRFMQKLFALPLLPENRVEDAFQELLQNDAPNYLVNTARFGRFVAYVYNQWIVNDVNRRMVNCYDRMGERRTNNDLEGWNSKIGKLMHQHPNLWVFIERLQALQKQNRINENLILQNPINSIRVRSPKQITKEAELYGMQQVYRNGQYANDLAYIREVARLMQVFSQ